MSAAHPFVAQTVLDCRHPRRLAEFYRELLGYAYRPGDEPPPDGAPDPNGEDWLVLRPTAEARTGRGLAFQANAEYVPPVWTPEADRPGDQQMMLHLDLTVPDTESLEEQRRRVLALGGALLLDLSDDAEEPLYVFADPAGHPFCIFVSTRATTTTRLHRSPELGVTDRAALDALLDSQWAGVLSCVVDGEPLAVPMLYARDGDRVLLHGSTGAGALRRVAAGAPAVLTVFALDALVVAPTTFESSVNYRSATVRGPLTRLDEHEPALDAFSEVLIPGRTAEVRRPTRKELAATMALSLPIVEGGWLLKVAADWPATPEEAGADPDVWSGLVPVRTVLDPPVPAPWAAHLPVPPSVQRLTPPAR